MQKSTVGSIIVGLVTLNSALSAHAFQGGGSAGNQGGLGFTGSPGVGFTGPRGVGFTDGATGFRGAGMAPGFGGNPFLGMRRFGADIRSPRPNTVDNPNANVHRMGVGWDNPYIGYHQKWVHGYWNGHHASGLGWRPSASEGSGADRSGLETGMGKIGWGLSCWMYGPVLYNFGYSNYSNPYIGAGAGGNRAVGQQPASYDYSQPIDVQRTPPERAVTDRARSTLDTARQAFKDGDQGRALELVDQALVSMPGDPTLHEFRALTLFALKRYDEAAAALHAVLSVEPGWDWTTLIKRYGDPETYTRELRALEAFSAENPKSAPAYIVLAYHYLTAEFADAAVGQLKRLTAVEPRDALSAQLLRQLEAAQQQVSGPELEEPKASTAKAPAARIAAEKPATGTGGKIEGIWTSQPRDDMNIIAIFQVDGSFIWRVSRQGQNQQFRGKFSSPSGILTLIQDQNNNMLVGTLRWTDETHVVFKVMGAGAGDPGLSLTKGRGAPR